MLLVVVTTALPLVEASSHDRLVPFAGDGGDDSHVGAAIPQGHLVELGHAERQAEIAFTEILNDARIIGIAFAAPAEMHVVRHAVQNVLQDAAAAIDLAAAPEQDRHARYHYLDLDQICRDATRNASYNRLAWMCKKGTPRMVS